MRPSHSTGSRFEVTTVAALRWRSTIKLVDVGGVDRVEGMEGEVIDDE